MYAKPVIEVVNFESTEIVVNLNVSGGEETEGIPYENSDAAP